jgi:hypothetical protein
MAQRLVDNLHGKTGMPPVKGLFDDATNPELPIGHALAPAVPLLGDDLAAEVYQAGQLVDDPATAAAKQLARAGPFGLTRDRACALYLYTCESPLYKALNAALLAEDRTTLKQYFFLFLRLLFGALDSLEAAAGGKEITLFRGVRLDLSAMYPGAYVKGRKLVWWPVTSCTAQLDVLHNPMLLGKQGPRTQFVVTTRHAVSIAALSALPGEAEWVLRPGTALVIDGVLDLGGGLTQIQVHDDDAAPPLVSRTKGALPLPPIATSAVATTPPNAPPVL